MHLYYPDLWEKIASRLALINEPFDLFVTLDVKDQDFQPTLANKNVIITRYIVPNRGRDVLPFLYVAKRLRAAGYEYVLKLHSKKSKHREDGSDWLSDLLEELLPTTEVISAIIEKLRHNSTGSVGPSRHLVSLKRHIGSNKEILGDLITRSYGDKVARKVLDKTELYPYFGGTMLWFRLEEMDKLLDLGLMPDDFQSEHGQIDGTIAHAIERFIGVMPKLNHKKVYTVSKTGIQEVPVKEYTEKYRYAP